ncbi:MAG: glycerol-3-phosphate dehydrogenase [Sneathiellaceae bacterium]
MATAQDRTKIFDVLVVGGSVTGCGLARDAAGRGLSVYLCAAGDLGSGASLMSARPAPDGLPFLQDRRIAPFRAAFAERDRLQAMAPHIVEPRRFVMPHDPQLRAAWRTRGGLFLADILGGAKRLPISIGVDLRSHRYGRPLKPDYPRGFVYSDCWMDESRLMLLNAVDAAARGARISPRTVCIGLRREDGQWIATLRRHGMEWQVRARLLANAAGHLLDRVRQLALGGAEAEAGAGPRAGRLVRNAQLVVPRLFQGSQAYLFQGEAGRPVFALPYQGAFTLIGTTEVAHPDPDRPAIAGDGEIETLCRAANRYLKRSIGHADIVSVFAGIRRLPGDSAPDGTGRPATLADEPRPLVEDIGSGMAAAPLLTLQTGRVAGYRRLAEAALSRLAERFPQAGRAWTDKTPLPGGDLPDGDAEAFTGDLILRYPGLDRTFLRRLSQRHGSLSDAVLANAKRPADLGRDFGGGLTECEVDWLHRNEWAEAAEDILWRRTKTGLFMSDQGRSLFADWFERQIAA